MISTGGLLAFAILLHMAIVMWCLPRRFGVAGLLAAQVLSLGAWGLVLFLSIATGDVDYDGASSFAGIIFDTLFFNGVLLPAAVSAAVLYHMEWRAQRTSSTALAQDDPVQG